MDGATRQKRSQAWMEYFGLAEVAKRPIGQYSKGMRQKLALARTLLHEPPVLLLDEPTSAMDPESAQLVRKAIASLRSEQRSIIICTHNLVEAEMLADKIAIIYRGRVLTSGTIEELKRNAAWDHPNTRLRVRGEWPHIEILTCRQASPRSKLARRPRFRVEDPANGQPCFTERIDGNAAWKW
jgi:ABC-2 type transport system ATP-binding protein